MRWSSLFASMMLARPSLRLTIRDADADAPGPLPFS
jgi:hypothetical protein